jgi:hypothetical protein
MTRHTVLPEQRDLPPPKRDDLWLLWMSEILCMFYELQRKCVEDDVMTRLTGLRKERALSPLE